jgi:hypothetical protein
MIVTLLLMRNEMLTRLLLGVTIILITMLLVVSALSLIPGESRTKQLLPEELQRELY